MATVVAEKYGSRLSDKIGELYYRVTGAADIASAHAAVTSSAPSSLGGLPLDDVDVEEVVGRDDEYSATARYGFSGSGGIVPETAPDRVTTFNAGLETAQLYHSLELITTKPTSGDAPDVSTFVKDGVSADVPVTSFSITDYPDAADVTGTYLNTLMSLRSKTNNGSVTLVSSNASLTFAAGELIYKGFHGGKVADRDYWQIEHQFAASPNKTSLTIAGISGVDKKGWEYAEIIQEEAEDTNTSSLVPKAKAVRVHRMYEAGDFNGLGLGS